MAYETNILAAIEIIEATAVKMSRDPQWQWQIVETPQVMGIDDIARSLCLYGKKQTEFG